MLGRRAWPGGLGRGFGTSSASAMESYVLLTSPRQRKLWFSDFSSEPQGVLWGPPVGGQQKKLYFSDFSSEPQGVIWWPPVGGQVVQPSPLPTELLHSLVLHIKVLGKFCLKMGFYCWVMSRAPCHLMSVLSDLALTLGEGVWCAL